MSYSIKVKVYQTNTNAFFQLVEKDVWYYANGGVWNESDGVHKLSMGGSGTSGMLRFRSEQGNEAFWVAQGVHNYKPWVDIVTNLTNDYTGVKGLPEYYGSTVPGRAQAREAQRTSWQAVNAQGRKITANFTVSSGNNLELNIIIG
ncbi:hypothetical protein GYMLUDRAFT_87113 [Collybiopsis luxurians FD-317 M1]|uniref:Lectin n=1 Tax=Collybiopsis luxurians FD-317 M1 TaxID=944289 RepID=A0A0D0CP99_9AGAR|nr:hypothetical protein GYMLUDRAFT_87113 [Collybiopsis luxurians FD-317 M1]